VVPRIPVHPRGIVPSIALVLALVAGGAPADAATAVLTPSRDTTMYAGVPTNSNGGGEHVFAGRTSGGGGSGSVRRGLMAFDLSPIPSGSTIHSVTLKLYCTKAAPGSAPQTIALHRVTSRWGEGITDGGPEEGTGAPAEPGDATWLMRFSGTNTPWGTPGGDFVATASASAVVGAPGLFYTWSSPGLVSEVQGWVSFPLTNQGWLLRGNEAVDTTTRRFASRNNGFEGFWPELTVVYTAPVTSLGATPDGHDLPGEPLRVAPAGAGDVELSWGASCIAAATDYAVYEGTLGDFENYDWVTCSTDEALSYTLTSPAGSTFWLVVPVDPDEGAEGSYGRASDGSERPPSAAACFPQLIDDPVCP
jgi:hypothetical protein